MKVLIVGINGFLGSHIAQLLLKLGSVEITGVYHQNRNRIPSGITVYPVDHLESLERTFDSVIIASAYIPYQGMDLPHPGLVDVNVKLLVKLADRFSFARLIFCSSISVYGSCLDALNEKACLKDPSLYGLSKLAGEFIIKNQANFVIIRFSSLYGAGMTSQTFLPQIITQAKERKHITLFGDGSRKQDYLHISDAAQLCINTLSSRGNTVYMGAHGRSHSNSEVAKIIQTYIPECTIRYEGSDTSPSVFCDASTTHDLLNFKPRYTLAEGLRELIVD